MIKKFLKGCLIVVLSFISLFMFFVTLEVLGNDSTSTENSTSVAEDNIANDETKIITSETDVEKKSCVHAFKN